MALLFFARSTGGENLTERGFGLGFDGGEF